MALRTFLLFTLSLLLGGTLRAQNQPPAPDILSVSVNPDNNAVTIKWTQRFDPSFPIIRYIINKLEYPRVQLVQPKFDAIDSVNAPTMTYTNPSTSVTKVDLATQAFIVTSRSSTPGSNISKLGDAHFTMLLTASTDSCSSTAKLTWRRYKTTNADLKEQDATHKVFNNAIEYEVWGYQSNGVFSQALAVSQSSRIKDTTFNVANLQVGVNYYFFIKAYLPNGEQSTSNRVSAKITGYSIPLSVHMSQVEISGANATLNFAVNNNPAADINPTYCVLERSIKPADGFSELYRFSNGITSYTDNNADPKQPNYYRISVLRCGTPAMTSDTINTIVLSATTQGEAAALSWTALNGQPVSYTVTRVKPDTTQVTTGLSDKTYSDNVNPLIQLGHDSFCYRITGSSASQTSISAEQCTTVTPQVYMPNAIDPTSSVANSTTGRRRNEFGPVINMPEANYSYHLVVFNRWNTKLFETTKSKGTMVQLKDLWDGTHKGKNVKPDVYLYTITVYFGNTQTSLNGTVTVVY